MCRSLLKRCRVVRDDCTCSWIYHTRRPIVGIVMSDQYRTFTLERCLNISSDLLETLTLAEDLTASRSISIQPTSRPLSLSDAATVARKCEARLTVTHNELGETLRMCVPRHRKSAQMRDPRQPDLLYCWYCLSDDRHAFMIYCTVRARQ